MISPQCKLGAFLYIALEKSEMEITDDVYSFNLGTKKGHNEKFVVTPIERDGRDSNSQRPA